MVKKRHLLRHQLKQCNPLTIHIVFYTVVVVTKRLRGHVQRTAYLSIIFFIFMCSETEIGLFIPAVFDQYIFGLYISVDLMLVLQV